MYFSVRLDGRWLVSIQPTESRTFNSSDWSTYIEVSDTPEIPRRRALCTHVWKHASQRPPQRSSCVMQPLEVSRARPVVRSGERSHWSLGEWSGESMVVMASSHVIHDVLSKLLFSWLQPYGCAGGPMWGRERCLHSHRRTILSILSLGTAARTR